MPRVKEKKSKKTRGAKKTRKATAKLRRNKISKSGKPKGQVKRSPGSQKEVEQQDNVVDELIEQIRVEPNRIDS